MKFPFTLRDRSAQANFDRVGLQLGFERVRIGLVTFTFTASALSPTVTVPHGLGTTPKLVIVSNQFIVGTADVAGYSANFTATDFLAFGRALNGAWTGSIIHSWLAAA